MFDSSSIPSTLASSALGGKRRPRASPDPAIGRASRSPASAPDHWRWGPLTGGLELITYRLPRAFHWPGRLWGLITTPFKARVGTLFLPQARFRPKFSYLSYPRSHLDLLPQLSAKLLAWLQLNPTNNPSQRLANCHLTSFTSCVLFETRRRRAANFWAAFFCEFPFFAKRRTWRIGSSLESSLDLVTLPERPPGAFCAAAPGTTTLGTSVRPRATGTTPATVTTMRVSAWPVRPLPELRGSRSLRERMVRPGPFMIIMAGASGLRPSPPWSLSWETHGLRQGPRSLSGVCP